MLAPCSLSVFRDFYKCRIRRVCSHVDEEGPEEAKRRVKGREEKSDHVIYCAGSFQIISCVCDEAPRSPESMPGVGGASPRHSLCPWWLEGQMTLEGKKKRLNLKTPSNQ